MSNDELLRTVTERAQNWLTPQYDEETREEVKKMLDAEDKTELIESFYKDLEFGTGGLRGIMGAGTNRMNRYTVGAATQGLANYLKDCFKDLPQIAVAVGHDVRHNSRKFAELTADIFSANGIKVYLLTDRAPLLRCLMQSENSVVRAVSWLLQATTRRNTTDIRLIGAMARR